MSTTEEPYHASRALGRQNMWNAEGEKWTEQLIEEAFEEDVPYGLHCFKDNWFWPSSCAITNADDESSEWRASFKNGQQPVYSVEIWGVADDTDYNRRLRESSI